MKTTDTQLIPGEMNDRLTIERATRITEQTLGEEQLTWSTWRREWAEVQPLNGIEITRGKQVAATVSHVLIMHYVKGLLPTDRIRLPSGALLQINSVIDVRNLRVKTVVYATERVDVTP